MNEEIRKLFPALEKYTYLNSAAVAPLPTVAIEAVNRQLRDVSENGSLNYPEWIRTKNRARDLLAGMLNVESEQIAFMRNTSDGFATVANGLDWAEGENIVTFEKREFPANFYAGDEFATRSESSFAPVRNATGELIWMNLPV
jgi:selenocysteine lyase/cysteine desulfurase